MLPCPSSERDGGQILSERRCPMRNEQKSVTLPKEKAHNLLTELMHESFDTACCAVDENGNLTITWPASTSIGKQLNGEFK